MRLLLDENFNHQIINGLKLRIPNLDYVIAQKTALRESRTLIFSNGRPWKIA